MRDIRIGAVQFEHRNADQEYNLSRIEALARQAVAAGAEVVSFHECSVSAYSFVQPLSQAALLDVAEPVPDGPSTQQLIQIAARTGVPILAGLFERDGQRVFNTYVCATAEGLLARHRKLHAFVNPHLDSGDQFTVFDLLGCRCGILTCYDNNLVENVRMTALCGAEIVFMPHVTGCLPSVMPGRGVVDPELWRHRDRDPVRLRQEFRGPKGREWLMRWLPARAYENGVYAVFTNPIGMDDDQVRNGNAMILDPFGDVICECDALDDDFTVGLCTADKRQQASGRRYLRARRPELYGKLVEPQDAPPVTEPGWKLRSETDNDTASH
ncbi:MAG: nitrilase family protein [Planctomycetaceae bacterium]